jgi:hypothetical protein
MIHDYQLIEIWSIETKKAGLFWTLPLVSKMLRHSPSLSPFLFQEE